MTVDKTGALEMLVQYACVLVCVQWCACRFADLGVAKGCVCGSVCIVCMLYVCMCVCMYVCVCMYRLHTKGSDLATECRRHEVAKSLGNQARGAQPACTMTTQNSKIRLISNIALKSRLITYLST